MGINKTCFSSIKLNAAQSHQLILPSSTPIAQFFFIFVSGKFFRQIFWSQNLILVSMAVIFHELGHALCAVHEGAPLCSVGILCFLCCPGAFVKMDLSRLSIWAKIRTFSAGVWHNLILSFICYLIIQSRDAIFDPFYSASDIFAFFYL